MKKQLLLLVLTLNFGGLCYGMEILKETFQGHINAKNWVAVCMFLSGNPTMRENCENALLQVPTDELNVIPDGRRGLFEFLLMCSHTSDGDDRTQWKALLKKLIYQGLDFRVKKQGKFVYNHNSYGDFSQGRADIFWELFDEIREANPKQGWEKGFEAEIAARKEQQRLEPAEQDQAAFNNKLVIGFQANVAPGGPVQPVQAQQNQVHDQQQQQQPTHDNASAQKAKAVFNKKLATAGMYLAIGCAVLAIGYQVYKRYTQDKTDDEEIDENQPAVTADAVKA
jgi:hypothetical protein